MSIVLVHDWIVAWRGGEKCLKELLAMFPNSAVFTLFLDKEVKSTHLPNVEVYSSFLSKLPYVKYYYRFLLPLYPLGIFDLSNKIKRYHSINKIDKVISVSHCVAKNILLPKNIEHICYCLTPIRYIWDQYDSYFKNKPYEILVRLIRKLFQKWDVESARRISKFIAISDFISNRILKYYNCNSLVVYPPVNIERFLKLKKIPENSNFYLMVNALVPYKKVDIVIKAFNDLDKNLVIIGDGPEKDYLLNLCSNKVKMIGWVSDDELDIYYRDSKALIYMAEEDFGIAPVEAQAAGKPVICLKTGGCKETSFFDGEDRTAVEIESSDPESVKNAIKLFEGLLEKGYFSSENCRRSALRFSVEKFKQEFKRVLTEC